jgi:hypothetical protein
MGISTQPMRNTSHKLQPEDFTILEEKQKQRVISVKRASEATPIIAVLIQDDLVSRVSKERIFSKDVYAIFSSLVIEAVQVA